MIEIGPGDLSNFRWADYMQGALIIKKSINATLIRIMAFF